MAEEPVAIRPVSGPGGLALDVRSSGALSSPPTAPPASGETLAETHEETRHETVIDAHAPPHALGERARASRLEARLQATLRAAAQRAPDVATQDEVAKLIRVWNDIAASNRADLLSALDVAAACLDRNPPNLRTAQGIRADLQRRLGRWGFLRQNSPAANVVLGLMTMLYISVGLVPVLAAFVDPGATLVGIPLDMLLLVAAAGALGSVISVMRRIRDFRGSTVASPLVLYLTGAFRPVIGVGFALFVYAVVNSKLIAFTPPAGGEPYFFAAVAFLAGFSEKLAPDLMEKAEDALTTSSVEQTQTVSRRVRAAPRS